jgi:ubiquitin-protein ligase
VDILDPVFNPNVYPSGRVCLGTKWLATETLDLIVLRVAKILTFDSDILNDRAPANMEAAYWYKAALAARPEAFPTEKIAIESEIPASKPAWKGVGS